MITEDYVSYETAKLLKEKGFDECTICKYADVGGITEKWYDDYRERIVRFNWEEGYLIEPLSEPKDQYETIGNTISAPTLQMAMKWLRDTFNLEIYPFHDTIQENNDWWYRIERHSKGCGLTEHESDVIYKTYEEACEAAIKYCLENLI